MKAGFNAKEDMKASAIDCKSAKKNLPIMPALRKSLGGKEAMTISQNLRFVV